MSLAGRQNLLFVGFEIVVCKDAARRSRRESVGDALQLRHRSDSIGSVEARVLSVPSTGLAQQQDLGE